MILKTPIKPNNIVFYLGFINKLGISAKFYNLNIYYWYCTYYPIPAEGFKSCIFNYLNFFWIFFLFTRFRRHANQTEKNTKNKDMHILMNCSGLKEHSFRKHVVDQLLARVEQLSWKVLRTNTLLFIWEKNPFLVIENNRGFESLPQTQIF